MSDEDSGNNVYDDPSGVIVRLHDRSGAFVPVGEEDRIAPPPIPDFDDAIRRPEDVPPAPPESSEELTTEIPRISLPPLAPSALRSEGNSEGEEEGEFEEYDDEDSGSRRSFAEVIGDWIQHRIAMGQARQDAEAPLREADIARKTALIEADTKNAVGLAEQNGKLRQAHLKARADRASARGKADSPFSGKRGKSPSSGLGSGKGGKKPSTGSGSLGPKNRNGSSPNPKSNGSKGSSKNSPKPNGAKGAGSDKSGGKKSRDGSRGGGLPWGKGKNGSGRGSDGSKGSSKGSGSKGGSKGRDKGSGGSGSEGKGAKGKSKKDGKDSSKKGKSKDSSTDSDHDTKANGGGKDPKGNSRKDRGKLGGALNDAFAFFGRDRTGDRRKDKDAEETPTDAAGTSDGKSSTNRKDDDSGSDSKGGSKLWDRFWKPWGKDSKEEPEEYLNSSFFNGDWFDSEEFARKWNDKAADGSSSSSAEGSSPGSDAETDEDPASWEYYATEAGWPDEDHVDDGPRRTTRRDPYKTVPAEDLGYTMDRPDRDQGRNPAADTEPAALTEAPKGLPRAPESHTERPGTTRPTTSEGSVTADAQETPPQQSGLAAEHQATITVYDFVDNMREYAKSAGRFDHGTAAINDAMTQFANQIRESARRLRQDDNIVPAVVNEVRSLAKDAEDITPYFSDWAGDCKKGSEHARKAATFVENHYIKGDAAAMDATGLDQASAASHH